MTDISQLNFNSVENVPGIEARAAFTINSATVFKEDVDIVPTIIDDTLSYVPWGGDNQLPYNIINLVERDETLSTCQVFNAEVCFGSGLRYDTCIASQSVKNEVEDFLFDNDLAALLPELVGASKWLSSSQAEYFGSTLFPTMDIVDAIGGATGSKWDKYQELHPQLYDLEASLAEEWFSLELMTQLRSENLRGTLSAKRKSIVLSIQASIVGYLKGGSFNSRRLADIVNHIRQNADDFSEWHNSETAKLFAPPVFRNKKNAAGYFF